jgi:hypothetical protein
MNRDDWDKRIAAGRNRLEDENHREAEMINKMQNHCCLGLIALYTFGVFFAFLMSRVREYPEVQATMIKLPVEKQHRDFTDETLRDLRINGQDFADKSARPGTGTSGAGSTGTAPSTLSGQVPSPKVSTPPAMVTPENPASLPPPSVETGVPDTNADNGTDTSAEYVQGMNSFLDTAESNMKNLVTFGQEFMHKPEIAKNEQWQAEATGALLSLKSAAAQMANMYRVPRSMRQVNMAAIDAARSSIAVDNDYAHAVTTGNPAAMKTVLDGIPAAQAALVKVGSLLDTADNSAHH